MASSSHPRQDHTKYKQVVRGTTKLIHQHQLDLQAVVIWVDFSCVDQEDAALQLKGINSLITYAARSHFVLTPVKPLPEDIGAFYNASHPRDLHNYGAEVTATPSFPTTSYVIPKHGPLS